MLTRYPDHRVEIRCPEIGINQEGFIPLFGKPDAEIPRQEALARTPFASSDRPYFRHLWRTFVREGDTEFLKSFFRCQSREKMRLIRPWLASKGQVILKHLGPFYNILFICGCLPDPDSSAACLSQNTLPDSIKYRIDLIYFWGKFYIIKNKVPATSTRAVD